MVVKITSSHSLQRALNYNEKKCQKNQARCIYSGNYLLQPGQMNFHEKMERMQDLIARNERTKKTNTLHISLNFDPSEKHDTHKLSQIAQTYMDKIGFGQQPYLVYQHHDAGHPHIHIVTTNIQASGKRIDTYNIGRNQSEKARKEIETEFNLVRAQDKKHGLATGINPVDVQKVQYGKSETRRSIANVLGHVIDHFKYTSVAELNAVLKQYNVVADTGTENGRIQKYGGLLYRLLDSRGNKIGVPIKASLFHNKPTLKYLEKKFEENEVSRQPEKKKLKATIDWTLAKGKGSLKEFIEALQKEKIYTVLRQNKDGLNYGITFIDFRTKAVFNGSDIGKSYSIAGIQAKLNEKPEEKSVLKKPEPSHTGIQKEKSVDMPVDKPEHHLDNNNNKDSLLKDLMDHEKNLNRVPGELLKKKRKKRNENL
jgi:hypothetical protein